MSVRYQYIKNPKTTIYQTPVQAYMLINGISEIYKLQRVTRKRNAGSLTCRHQLPSKEQLRKKQEREYYGQSNKKRQKRERMKSCDRDLFQERKRVKELQHEQHQQKLGYLCCEYHPNIIKERAVSFQNLNLIDQHKPINCIYSKELQKQNVELKKQNKVLQNYVKLLQMRCVDLNNNGQKSEEKDKKISENISKKNGFGGRKVSDYSDKHSQVVQFLGSNMCLTKPLNQWHGHLS